VNWAAVAWLSSIAFLATVIGNILIFKYWFWAAILAGVLFAAGYVFLAYYPHERPVPGLKTGARGAASPTHATRQVLAHARKLGETPLITAPLPQSPRTVSPSGED